MNKIIVHASTSINPMREKKLPTMLTQGKWKRNFAEIGFLP